MANTISTPGQFIISPRIFNSQSAIGAGAITGAVGTFCGIKNALVPSRPTAQYGVSLLMAFSILSFIFGLHRNDNNQNDLGSPLEVRFPGQKSDLPPDPICKTPELPVTIS